jgi:hypothetical protein
VETFFILGDEIKEDQMGGACGTHGTEEKCIQVLGPTPERNRLLEMPRNRRQDSIYIDFKESGWVGVDWFDMDRTRINGGLS